MPFPRQASHYAYQYPVFSAIRIRLNSGLNKTPFLHKFDVQVNFMP